MTHVWDNYTQRVRHDPRTSGCFYTGKVAGEEYSYVAVSLCNGMVSTFIVVLWSPAALAALSRRPLFNIRIQPLVIDGVSTINCYTVSFTLFILAWKLGPTAAPELLWPASACATV